MPEAGFPSDAAVLGTPYALPQPVIHPIGTPYRQSGEMAPYWMWAIYATIGVSAIGLILSAFVIATRLFSGGPALALSGQSAALGVQFRYPGNWYAAEQPALNLFGVPLPAVLLADRPINGAPNTGSAQLVLAVQRIPASDTFGIPAACDAALGGGPVPAFKCMVQAGYAVPAYDTLSGMRGAARLAGTLPPTSATRPRILMPYSNRQWIAVVIVYWDGASHARDQMADIARSVHPTG